LTRATTITILIIQPLVNVSGARHATIAALPTYSTNPRTVVGTGFELPTENAGNADLSLQSGAESGALGAQGGAIAPELRAIIDAWPTLPEPIKKGVLAMVRTVEG
jgi:hypothetical protein